MGHGKGLVFFLNFKIGKYIPNLQETWMFPSILPFRPDLAEKMLSYRIIRIFEAMNRASEGGYNGARYINIISK